MDDTRDTAPATLAAVPDWRYLLREVYETYRASGAGGSAAIRAHQRDVRETVSSVIRSDPPLTPFGPEAKPVTAHLRRALDLGRMGPVARLSASVEAVSGLLAWRHGYERMPRTLAERFAFAQIAGPGGPVSTGRVILGLVLFAPGCTYPAHAHDGITESYVVLAGTVSQNDDGVYAPGSMIFNPPGRTHRITVGERDPALLFYAWTGPEERLANQKLVFSRTRRASD